MAENHDNTRTTEFMAGLLYEAMKVGDDEAWISNLEDGTYVTVDGVLT